MKKKTKKLSIVSEGWAAIAKSRPIRLKRLDERLKNHYGSKYRSV